MEKKPLFLEICCGSAEDAIEAAKGGAHRVELNSDLFHGGLLEVRRQGCAARDRLRPGQQVTPGISHPRLLRIHAEGTLQNEHAPMFQQVVHAGLFDPSPGLVALQVEPGHGFDRVASQHDIAISSAKFLGDVHGAGKGAIAFEVESCGNSRDGVVEQGVPLNLEFGEPEAGANGLQLAEHRFVRSRLSG